MGGSPTLLAKLCPAPLPAYPAPPLLPKLSLLALRLEDPPLFKPSNAPAPGRSSSPESLLLRVGSYCCLARLSGEAPREEEGPSGRLGRVCALMPAGGGALLEDGGRCCCCWKGEVLVVGSWRELNEGEVLACGDEPEASGRDDEGIGAEALRGGLEDPRWRRRTRRAD